MNGIGKVGRMPYDWNDLGPGELTSTGIGVLISLITKRLPRCMIWTRTDELLAPADFDTSSIDINAIVRDAWSEMATKYGSDDMCWKKRT